VYFIGTRELWSMIYKRQGLLIIINSITIQFYSINMFSLNDTNVLGNKYQKNMCIITLKKKKKKYNKL